jgi:hypothetical protein
MMYYVDVYQTDGPSIYEGRTSSYHREYAQCVSTSMRCLQHGSHSRFIGCKSSYITLTRHGQCSTTQQCNMWLWSEAPTEGQHALPAFASTRDRKVAVACNRSVPYLLVSRAKLQLLTKVLNSPQDICTSDHACSAPKHVDIRQK